MAMAADGPVSRQYTADYLNIPSKHRILKLLTKQGDKEVFFADSIVKVNREGQIKRYILIITNLAIYALDNRWGSLKRRIALPDIQHLCLSELNDNFFAIIMKNGYDYLVGSTRKSEIVNAIVSSVNSLTHSTLEVLYKNRFEYRVDSETFMEAHFEEANGGVKMRIVKASQVEKG